MKARPILFSAPMVRALLEGRKTQTRRILKPQPIIRGNNDCVIIYARGRQRHSGPADYLIGKILPNYGCPYGKSGDLLWVRENIWQRYSYHNDADPQTGCSDFKCNWLPGHAYMADGGDRPDGMASRPCIHMPRIASRLTLEITSVRVERLQNISEMDALCEGVNATFSIANTKDMRNVIISPTFIPPFREIWESINGNESWYENPWVWALTFNVHQQNINDFLRTRAA